MLHSCTDVEHWKAHSFSHLQNSTQLMLSSPPISFTIAFPLHLVRDLHHDKCLPSRVCQGSTKVQDLSHVTLKWSAHHIQCHSQRAIKQEPRCTHCPFNQCTTSPPILPTRHKGIKASKVKSRGKKTKWSARKQWKRDIVDVSTHCFRKNRHGSTKGTGIPITWRGVA